MSNKYVKVQFHTDWADEMDIEGFDVVDKEKFFELYNKVKMIDHPIEVGFGTNENNYYKKVEDFLEEITVTDISDDVAEILIKEVGQVGFDVKGELEFLINFEEDYDSR